MKEQEICDFLRNEIWRFLDELPTDNELNFRFYKCCYVAGGAIYSLRHDRIPNDYDIFVSDPEIIEEFKDIPDFWGHVSHYALSKGKFQVVTKYHGEPLDNVREFDFKHNMYWYKPYSVDRKRIHSAHPDEQGLTISKFEWLNGDTLEFNELRPREVERCFLRIKKFRKRGMKVPFHTYMDVLKRCKPKDLVRFKVEQVRRHGGGTY